MIENIKYNGNNGNGNINVLLIIDFEGTRKVVKKFITLMNPKVHLFEAANMDTALEISGNEQIDVVVADENAVRKDSYEYEKCEMKDPKVKVLVLSSHPDRVRKEYESEKNIHVFDKINEIDEFYNLLAKFVVFGTN